MKTLTKTDLSHFTGTEQWYRHPLMRDFLYTDGARFVAEHGAYWLLDEIAFAQDVDRVGKEEFQLWRLSVDAKKAAGLYCEDGNGKTVYEKAIEWTDFSLPEIVFYFRDNVLMLPSEY